MVGVGQPHLPILRHVLDSAGLQHVHGRAIPHRVLVDQNALPHAERAQHSRLAIHLHNVLVPLFHEPVVRVALLCAVVLELGHAADMHIDRRAGRDDGLDDDLKHVIDRLVALQVHVANGLAHHQRLQNQELLALVNVDIHDARIADKDSHFVVAEGGKLPAEAV